MGRWGKYSLAAACVALGVGALSSVVALTGCDACAVGAPCPNNTFGIESSGRCIVAVDSRCFSQIASYSTGCGDSGPAPAGRQRGNAAMVFPPTRDGGTTSTCDVKATLDDGTTVAITVQFTPVQSQCCGLVYDISPPDLVLNWPPEDGGLDATDDADATGGADAADATD